MSVRDNQMINQNTDEEMAKLAALLGGTADDGGTPDAGTLMAKLNALLEAFEAGVTANVVKSIQQGSVTIGAEAKSANATISAVNTAKAVVLNNGAHANNTVGNRNYSEIGLKLTNSTTVTAYKTNTDSNQGGYTAYFTVLEHY